MAVDMIFENEYFRSQSIDFFLLPGLELLQSMKTRNLEFIAEHVDEAWIQIAERRFAQFESGAVKPVSRESEVSSNENMKSKTKMELPRTRYSKEIYEYLG